MLEKEIEKELLKRVREKGGLCIKLVSPSMAGLPDRLILLPKAKLGFIEVKRPGEKPRPLQLRRLRQISNLGFDCFLLDEKKDIQKILQTIGGDAD